MITAESNLLQFAIWVREQVTLAVEQGLADYLQTEAAATALARSRVKPLIGHLTPWLREHAILAVEAETRRQWRRASV